MNLTLSLSLQQRALTNIAITLWSQGDIGHLLSKSPLCTLSSCNWKQIEKFVIEKSLKLQLPKLLKQKLLDFIRRVGLQITIWVNFHYGTFVTELPSMFVWTSAGTIDNTKTAELLVMNGTLDSKARFMFAFMYCLEDKIKYCWNSPTACAFRFICPRSVTYWSDYMQKLNGQQFNMEEYSSDLDLYPLIILEAIKSVNEAAIKYFFQKLNERDDDLLMVCARSVASKINCFTRLGRKLFLEQYSGVVVFLFSEMDTEQQAELFASHAYALLMCFLVWPRRSLFMEIVKDKWDFISERCYNDLFHCIAEMRDSESELLEEFWQQSPETYKQYVTVESNILHLVCNLYKSGNEKIIKLILKYASISDRKRIIFEHKSIELFKYLVSAEKWNSIVFLIQECSSSLDELMVLKSTVRKYVTKLQDVYIKKYQWDMFFQVLNRCTFGCEKEKCTEDYITYSKKHLYKCIEE